MVAADLAKSIGHDAETEPEPIQAVQREDDDENISTFLSTHIWFQAFYQYYGQVQLIQRVEYAG